MGNVKIEIEIPCISCGRVVKKNGVKTRPHSILEHRYSAGEKAAICLECQTKGWRKRWTGEGANWKTFDQPAYKALQTEICAECRRQHVTAEGEPVCSHQVVSHWDGREKKICRPCWGQAIVKAKYTGSSPWTAAEWVEKI